MSTRNAIVLGVTAVCAALGAWIGLLFWTLDPLPWVAVVGIGAVLGVVVAFGLTVDRRRVTRTVAPASVQREPVSARVSPAPVLAPTPAPEPTPQPANRTWWRETPAATGPSAPSAPRPAQEGYDVDRAVVAQCPRCGDFRLDLKQDGDACAFHCRNPNCGHRWEWRAGTPWPTTVVRRNLTG